MRLPRFSLLSLLLFTLLTGSAVALWMHWPAWRTRALLVNGSFFGWQISADRSLVLILATPNHFLYDQHGNLLQQFPADEAHPWAALNDSATHVLFRLEQDGTPQSQWNIATRSWEEYAGPTRMTGWDYETISPDGRWVLVRTNERMPTSPARFRLYNSATRTEVLQWDIPSTTSVELIFDASTPKTDALIVKFEDKCERWDLNTLTCVRSFALLGDSELSPDCRWIAVEKQSSNSILVLDTRTGVGRFEIVYPQDAPAPTLPSVRGLLFQFSKDGEDFCVLNRALTFAQLWSTSTGTKKSDMELPEFSRATPPAIDRVDYFTFSIDPRFLQAIYNEGETHELFVWDRSGALVYSGFTLERPADSVPMRIMDDAHQVFEPPSKERIALLPGNDDLRLLADPARALARTLGNEAQSLLILERHRPEAWWGIAWLPEFWSTVVFAGLFGWNLWRGRFSR